MQAARGTSLGRPEVPVTTQSTGRRRRLLFLAVAVVLLTVDQVTKVLAVDRLTDRGEVPLVGDVLVLRLIRNPGAAFSAGTEYTVVLTCLAITAVVVVLWIARRVADRVWAVALGLLLAGVGGNLVDRLLREPGPMRGHVVDFLKLPNWPIFNIADICINLAAGLILVQAFRGVRVDGVRESRTKDESTKEDSAKDDGE